VAARHAIGMCVFSHFCVDFQSSVLPSLTLACAPYCGQCDGTFCFAIVFLTFCHWKTRFCQSGRRSLTVDPFAEGRMRNKHGVYGQRQLLSLYSTALAHSDDVQSRLSTLGLWTVCHLNGRPRLPLLRPPGRSSTLAFANDASSRQQRLRHNRKPPDHTCKSMTAAVGDHCRCSRRSSVTAVHCWQPCLSRSCGASVEQSARFRHGVNVAAHVQATPEDCTVRRKLLNTGCFDDLNTSHCTSLSTFNFVWCPSSRFRHYATLIIFVY